MKTNTILVIAVILILIGQVAMFFSFRKDVDSATLKATEAISDSMLRQAERNRAQIDSILTLIDRDADTVNIIKNQRTINNNNYVTDVNSIFRADRGQQFATYRRNVSAFDSLVLAGFLFRSPGE